MPMPSKRRSLVVQTSMDAYTPPGECDAHSAVGDTATIASVLVVYVACCTGYVQNSLSSAGQSVCPELSMDRKVTLVHVYLITMCLQPFIPDS